MDHAEAFGRALRRRRLEAGLTQEQTALAADLERVFISWLETGKRQPTFGTILKLANAIGCTAGDLVSEAEKLAREGDLPN